MSMPRTLPGAARDARRSSRPAFLAREEMRAWADEGYTPERFDLEPANAAVAAI
jgi:hypothetical protein